MCLSDELLQMEYSKESETYIGTGYKNYNVYEQLPPLDVWLIATGEYNRSPKIYNPNFKFVYPEELARVKCNKLDKSSKSYYPGFHIFIDIENAKKYCDLGYKYSIYKVSYKEIIGFGSQNLYNDTKESANCVIAKYMLIHSKPVFKGNTTENY